MPRVARIVVPDVPHHVTQRGNNRQDTFFVDDDYETYLAILGKQAARYGLRIFGYCLMTNHVHLIVVPGAKESLAKTIGRTDFLYTRYINRLHGRSGHLWQNRFYSCALEDEALWVALAYVDRNPVRAGLVQRAWEYPWSSAAAHIGESGADGLLDMAAWRKMSEKMDYKAMLLRVEDEAEIRQLRRSTHTGRPLGSDAFLAKLEHAMGKRLRPLAVGRPKTGRKPRTK